LAIISYESYKSGDFQKVRITALLFHLITTKKEE